MIEIKLDIDGIDYDTVIPVIVPMLIKNKIAAKAAISAASIVIKNKSQRERNETAVKTIKDRKNKIIELCNKELKEKGIKGYVCNIDADII